jgi:hypothetical protein
MSSRPSARDGFIDSVFVTLVASATPPIAVCRPCWHIAGQKNVTPAQSSPLVLVVSTGSELNAVTEIASNDDLQGAAVGRGRPAIKPFDRLGARGPG